LHGLLDALQSLYFYGRVQLDLAVDICPLNCLFNYSERHVGLLWIFVVLHHRNQLVGQIMVARSILCSYALSRNRLDRSSQQL